MQHTVNLPSLTVTAATSPDYPARSFYDLADYIHAYGDAAAFTGTITVEVWDGAAYKALEEDLAVVTLISDTQVTFRYTGWEKMKFISSGSEVAPRVFIMTATERLR